MTNHYYLITTLVLSIADATSGYYFAPYIAACFSTNVNDFEKMTAKIRKMPQWVIVMYFVLVIYALYWQKPTWVWSTLAYIVFDIVFGFAFVELFAKRYEKALRILTESKKNLNHK
ncbi:hypothetical protein [Geobacter grbiciae]|uniref:hypothetical protein n=1 Tax=Geobacter grbiciae TaxID=155042 RepID=UPI001C0299F2|nr:hypothetical protein [Geobacter grbiciae]MBT1073972.1 hypothetical protein [Geobacter grbiciae]